MNAFRFEGAEYRKDPFMYQPDLPSVAGIFDFTSFQPRATERASSPEAPIIEEQIVKKVHSSKPDLFMQVLDDLRTKRVPDYYYLRFWEDISTSKKPRSTGSISQVGIISKERSRLLNELLEDHMKNLFYVEHRIVEWSIVRKNIEFALMGIEGEFFVLDSGTGEFSINNLAWKLEEVSSKQI